MEDCLFCKIINREIPAEIIYENDDTLAFLDIKPNNIGHTLVIPKQHSRDFASTDPQIVAAIANTVHRVAPAVLRAVGAPGFNIAVNNGAVAGQVIFHTHWHIIPRFSDDGYEVWHGREYKEGEMAEVAQHIRTQL